MQRKANHRPYVIDESNSWHVAWWATVLGVSEGALLTAIAVVGNESYAVEEYFGIRRKRELETARGPANAPTSIKEGSGMPRAEGPVSSPPNVPRE